MPATCHRSTPGQTVELTIQDLGNFEYDQEKGGSIPGDVQRVSFCRRAVAKTVATLGVLACGSIEIWYLQMRAAKASSPRCTCAAFTGWRVFSP